MNNYSFIFFILPHKNYNHIFFLKNSLLVEYKFLFKLGTSYKLN